MSRRVRERSLSEADIKVRSYILKTAMRHLGSKRHNGKPDYHAITSRTNERFNTKYTLYQVAGFIGASLLESH